MELLWVGVTTATANAWELICMEIELVQLQTANQYSWLVNYLLAFGKLRVVRITPLYLKTTAPLFAGEKIPTANALAHPP